MDYCVLTGKELNKRMLGLHRCREKGCVHLNGSYSRRRAKSECAIKANEEGV